MATGDETADSYKTTADLLLSKKGDRNKIISYLFSAADLYSKEHHDKAAECLDELHKNLKGSTTEFELEQYFRYLHRLARSYENLDEVIIAADTYAELAKEIYKLRELLEQEKIFSYTEIIKKFSAYLAKSLMLYDSVEKFDSILKLARTYYKEFPVLQQSPSIRGEIYFCYEHIITAADRTGSRYFREYYEGLDRKLRGIPLDYEGGSEDEGKDERKGPYTKSS